METNAKPDPENTNDKKVEESASEQKRIILEKICTEASRRPLVPFLGAGVSLSAGFPTIKFVIHYLAKVDFAIRFGVFEGRFPVIKESQKSATETYRQHPSKYLEDFGWPNLGQLNADIWDWLERGKPKEQKTPYKGEGREIIFDYCTKKINQYENDYKKYQKYKNAQNNPTDDLKPERCPTLPDLLSNDITHFIKDAPETRSLRKGQEPLDLRDHQQAIVQWTLRKELAERESGTTQPLLYRWLKWKDCYFNGNKDGEDSELLYGDWEVFLDRLCEGNFNLVDALFTSFEQELNPTISHRFLAFLKPKLGIPLILTTNFDSLLERAFRDEEIMPKVFDVHRDAELPNPILVRQQFSLIKLHGSAYGIRHGERLKYKLETDAQNNALGYLPKDAIILVMGFNGSERRIMQMLQAIVGEGKLEKEKVRLIWIQGPSKPGPLFDELSEASNGTVLSCKVGHADTFLQELYFLMSRNGYQSSAKNYSTMPNRPLMMELKDFTLQSNAVVETSGLMGLEYYAPDIKKEKRDKKEKKRRPVHLCIGNIGAGQPSSNWPSLAAMAFTNQLLEYTVIWINLESHHTVEGVIAEFFDRVRVLDPQAPSCVITNMDKYEDEAIEKAVDRISDVFKRGRYALVLDGVESFGRPQMVHHGITQFENSKNISQLKNFGKFLFALLGIKNMADKKPQYWDSYVVVTADNLRLRHQQVKDDQQGPKPESYQLIEQILDGLKNVTEDYLHINAHLREVDNNYADFTKHEIRPEAPVPTGKLSACWVYKKTIPDENYNNSKERAKGVFALLAALRTKNEINEKDAIEAFICLLSVFRRPRSLPLIHSIIDRWALRKIGGAPLDDEQSETADKAITGLLLTISLNNDKNPVGVVSQNHEGGTVWLYREVYEATYDALTEHLRLHDWEEVTWENGLPKDKGLEEAIIDGILNVSWHMYAARAYYVDIFLPSHDIHAFYEYLYHRVSATKVITLLITIIGIHEQYKDPSTNNTDECYLIGKLNEYCEPIINQNLVKDAGTISQGNFAWYASCIGVFDPIGNEKSELKSTSDLKRDLVTLRKQALETLSTALKKNKLLFRSVSTPDTVIAWSNQFLDSELDNMKKVELDMDVNLTGCIETEIDTLRSQFEKLRFQAWLSKMDYESILSNCLGKNNENHKAIDSNWDKPENLKFSYKTAIKRYLEPDYTLEKNELIFYKKQKLILDKYHEIKKFEERHKTIIDKYRKKINLKKNYQPIIDEYNKGNEFKEHNKPTIDKYNQRKKFEGSYKAILNKHIEIDGFLSLINGFETAFKTYKEQDNELNVKLDSQQTFKDVDDKLKILFKDVEDGLKKLFSFTRCLVERCHPEASEIADLIDGFLIKIESPDLEVSETAAPDPRTFKKSNSSDLQHWIKKQRRYALELKCRIQFIYWFYWEPLLDRKSSKERTTLHKILGKEFRDDPKVNKLFIRLQNAETCSIEYENLLRVTTETNDDDANCRSTALTLRARALYLRGHFQQAHHCLDLATTGFLPDRLENKIYISIVHIIRAELLAISAHEHYFSLGAFDEVAKLLNKQYLPFHKIDSAEIKLRELSDNFKFSEHDKRLKGQPESLTGRKEFPKKMGEFAEIVLPIANSSLKKIERAEQELHHAETLLRDLSHHNIWLIYLEFGWAQIQIERQLYEIETLFLSWHPLSVTEYLQKSGHLEQKIINVLRRIRNVMDAIPYQPKSWEDIKVEEGKKTRGLLMFRIEVGTYRLWRQLFVVGAYYSSLLNYLYKDTLKLNKNTAIFEVAEDYIKEIISSAANSGKDEGNYLKQWKLWCSSMRFENFSRDENMKSFELNQEIEKGLKSLSLRAAVIKSMIAESSDEKIKKMWDIRRSNLER